MEFLEDERDSWRAFEALATLPDEALERPTGADSPAHGWSGRDLISHMVAWRQHALTMARELAMNETSPTRERMDEEWDTLGGDAINERLMGEWRALPLDEVRRRMAEIPGELRGYLTVVPETRWIKNAEVQKSFVESTLEHDDDHRAALEAILAAAGVRGP